MASTPRNSPCPCGSGKRYKYCCGAENREAASALSLRDIMLSALECQKRGDLPGAETLYRQALAIRPDEPDCLHMLGVICHETGRNREAYDLVYRALSLTDWRIEWMRHTSAESCGGFR